MVFSRFVYLETRYAQNRKRYGIDPCAGGAGLPSSCPANGRTRGGSGVDNLLFINGVLWCFALCSLARLAERYGKWKTLAQAVHALGEGPAFWEARV